MNISMPFSTISRPFVLLVLVLVLLNLINQSRSLTIATRDFISFFCPNTTTFAALSTYQKNLNLLLETLSSRSPLAPKNGYYETTVGHDQANTVYGSFLCRGDYSNNICSQCVPVAIDDLRCRCPRGKEAIMWYEACMIRYSNTRFFGQLDVLPMPYNINVVRLPSNDVSTGFMGLVGYTLDSITTQAAEGQSSGKKFAPGDADYNNTLLIYAIGQCVPDLSSNDCNYCLRMSIKKLQTCCYGSVGARVVCPSCSMRYELYPFYNATAVASVSVQAPARDASSQVQRRGKSPNIFLITIPAAIMVLLVSGIWICVHTRKAKEPYTVPTGSIGETFVECLQFKLSTIRAATSDFSIDNKLGEGGFGEVYKGILQNGQEIAVKRLSRDSKQGVAEFKTEVLLLAKLQHRNLVKLLGFCPTTEEQILVYEFLPNSSLDRFLYDPMKRAYLDWSTRFKIITGIARGLLYLHEDSRLKVIHRDLKLSNILLDEAMNPKISDFGLAKFFDADETQGKASKIIGTYGYMAPEYAIIGRFSAKSDVYSFGVIVLEIVSGERNHFSDHPQLDEALLCRAWRLWKEGAALELVDSTLGVYFASEEVMKCIHIGLICIQENAARRPRMTSVVAALSGECINLPLPTAPHFFTQICLSSSNSQEMENEFQGGNYANTFTGSENITDLHPR